MILRQIIYQDEKLKCPEATGKNAKITLMSILVAKRIRKSTDTLLLLWEESKKACSCL